MKASLPLFDLPEIREATNQWWQGIARHLKAHGIASAPTRLDRPSDLDNHWRQGALLLSQTCGYSLLKLSHRLSVIGTPCYEAPGCEGHRCSGYLLVHDDHPALEPMELYGTHCVVDRYSSHFGYNALRSLIAPHNDDGLFFKTVQISGSPRRSLIRMHQREADVCAIDALSFALIDQYAPELVENLRILCTLSPAPSPPYISAQIDVLDIIREAVQSAFADPSLQTVRETLKLKSFTQLSLSAYYELEQLEKRAKRLGYGQLR